MADTAPALMDAELVLANVAISMAGETGINACETHTGPDQRHHPAAIERAVGNHALLSAEETAQSQEPPAAAGQRVAPRSDEATVQEVWGKCGWGAPGGGHTVRGSQILAALNRSRWPPGALAAENPSTLPRRGCQEAPWTQRPLITSPGNWEQP